MFCHDDVITMRSLGGNGRFGNQVFQYAFLRFYAREHGLRIEIPNWDGELLFGAREPRVTNDLERFVVWSKEQLEEACRDGAVKEVDFWGFFQDVEYYNRDACFFRSLFKPVDSIESSLRASWSKLEGHSVVGLHMRYGDYGYSIFYETPHRWVMRKLEEIWSTLRSPVLYLATDDSRALRLFRRFSPLQASDVFEQLSCPQYYYDFWALTQANAMGIIANSSFSYAAAMLNCRCSEWFRPSLRARDLIRFTPWNGPVLLSEDNWWLRFLAKHPQAKSWYTRIHRKMLFNR